MFKLVAGVMVCAFIGVIIAGILNDSIHFPNPKKRSKNKKSDRD